MTKALEFATMGSPGTVSCHDCTFVHWCGIARVYLHRRQGAAPLRARCRRFRCLAPRVHWPMLDCGHLVGALIPRREQSQRALKRRAMRVGDRRASMLGTILYYAARFDGQNRLGQSAR